MPEMLQKNIARNKLGEPVAILSVLSAHIEVLNASLQLASNLNRPLVIEATSSQFTQFGSNTVIGARKFMASIDELKSKHEIESNIVEHGGDHLGPQVLKSKTADVSMDKEQYSVCGCVHSSIKKIYLDYSEGFADKPPLVDSETFAERDTDTAVSYLDPASAPEAISFRIRTELLPPGAAQPSDDGKIIPRSPKSVVKKPIAHLTVFAEKGIVSFWPLFSDLVVQKGIEFEPEEVFFISKGANSSIRDPTSKYPEIYFEAHSTDFQPKETFAKLDKMGSALQKLVQHGLPHCEELFMFSITFFRSEPRRRLRFLKLWRLQCAKILKTGNRTTQRTKYLNGISIMKTVFDTIGPCRPLKRQLMT